jgi:hypothetical protein
MNTTSYAATPEEVLKACDSALNAKIQEASLCSLGVQLRTNEIERVTKENAQLRESSVGLFSNPMIWAAIGVIAGTWIGARATR